MTISQRTIQTSSGVVYEIENCHKMMARFPEKSPEYLFAFKIFVALARKASMLNFEGEVYQI